MSEQDPIKIFVTHEFQDSEAYARVFEYLESRDKFFYINCSRPEDKPEGGKEAVQDALRNQIKRAEVVIHPAGTVTELSQMLRFELTVAQAFDKPILAIQAFGGTIAISREIMDMAADMVDWNDRIIADTAERLARGGDDKAWDTIEFTLD
jgi:hypothetical protein